jgi:hypothetical protein
MKDFKNSFKIIRELVNKWDPCNLISSGAPDDEYDALTIKLQSDYVNNIDLNDQKEDLLKLLDEYYGGPSMVELSTENQIKLVKDIDHVLNEIKNNANMH